MTDDSPLSPALPPDLASALGAALAMPAQRALALDVGGRRFWLKRPEAHRGWKRRLQKGDPQRALDADRAGLKAAAARGLPVPRIVAEGPDYLLIEDAGRPIVALMRDPGVTEAQRLKALREGAAALAAMHVAGVAHGRPKVRDICWAEGQGARLIDFEEFTEGATEARIGRDAMLFLHSILQVTGRRDAMFDAAAESYRAQAPAGAWVAMRAGVARLNWLMPLARLVLRLQPRAHELRAALLLREAMRE